LGFSLTGLVQVLLGVLEVDRRVVDLDLGRLLLLQLGGVVGGLGDRLLVEADAVHHLVHDVVGLELHRLGVGLGGLVELLLAAVGLAEHVVRVVVAAVGRHRLLELGDRGVELLGRQRPRAGVGALDRLFAALVRAAGESQQGEEDRQRSEGEAERAQHREPPGAPGAPTTKRTVDRRSQRLKRRLAEKTAGLLDDAPRRRPSTANGPDRGAHRRKPRRRRVGAVLPIHSRSSRSSRSSRGTRAAQPPVGRKLNG
jgi:hypothetical protein